MYRTKVIFVAALLILCSCQSESFRRRRSFDPGFPFGNNFPFSDGFLGPDFGANLGRNIEEQIRRQLEPLNHLGQDIQQQVEHNLLPVRAMQARLEMINGIGGVTIIKYSPGGKTLIARDNQRYECLGTVSDDGKCSGSLKAFDTNSNKENYCYMEPNARVNNYYCFSSGPNRGISISSINGNVECTSTDRSPVLLITIDEFHKMCDNVAASVQYTYISDPNSHVGIKIPNQNPYIKCQTSKPGVCVFS